MRKIMAIMAVAAAVLVAVLTPAGPAAAAPATGELRSATGSLRPSPVDWAVCLDVPGGDSDSGTSVRLFAACNKTSAQRFTLDLAAIGTIRVLGKCVDVQGGGTHNGARVQIWDCNGTGAQLWQFVPQTPEFGQLRNPQSGRCLTSNNDGSGVFDCNPALAAQSFWLGRQIF